ncbi:class I mannose-6-phosphate isomerase [Caloramator sp. mosi_1]|uniref:type I phosphomannose isomerase catalytic subunit n=1 Tax=Caloramator sp. mosi_1 TaxID=3023090 RepID=UPI002361CFD5|nr:type I phosphomannose isomerase catalytic subunit [Caloramator sp. mosi_1]WDC84770.1 class I mannose-6-phosphate isomerase [Caloramator sp. mosi_1]
MEYDRFPILIKYIDANDKLSVQVHPDDEYALKNEGDYGKTEVWYVVDAKENAKLIFGVKEGTTKEDFINALERKNLEECLNYVKVKKET